MTTPRNPVAAFLFRLLSLGAGEAPDKASSGPGTVRDGGSMIGGNLGDGDDTVEEEADGAPAPKAPADAGRKVTKPAADAGRKVTKPAADEENDEDPDSEEADSEDEGEEDGESDGESEVDDTDDEGDGADELGVDPAISVSITRNWQSRFDASKNVKEADPLAMVRALKPKLSPELRARVTQMFKEEKDIDAIAEVIAEVVPEILGSYDSSRVAPALTEQQINSRNTRLVKAIADFDEAHPGVRTKKVTEKMAAIYDQFQKAYGYKAADEIPVEDYVIMAGASPRKGGKAVKTTPKGKTPAERAEADKAAALSSVRQPDRIGRPKNAGAGNKKRGEADDVRDFSRAFLSRDADPFVIR